MNKVVLNVTKGCTICRKVIQPGEAHRYDKATNSHFHLACAPDDKDIQVAPRVAKAAAQ